MGKSTSNQQYSIDPPTSINPVSTPPQIINTQNLHLAPPAKKCASKRQTSTANSSNQVLNLTKPFIFGQNTTNNLVNLFPTSSGSSVSNNNIMIGQSNNSNTSKHF